MEAAAAAEAELKDGGRAGAGSQMSSVKDDGVKSADPRSDMMSGDGESKGPPYTPCVPEMWQAKLREFAGLNVIKFPRIWQSLFYLLKFSGKDSICVPGTNKLEWKNCRQMVK